MKNKDLVARSQFIRSIFIPFPFLIILGMIIGYVKYGNLGTLYGIMAAAVLSVIVGLITTAFTDTSGKSTSGMLYGQGKSTIKLQERLERESQTNQTLVNQVLKKRQKSQKRQRKKLRLHNRKKIKSH